MVEHPLGARKTDTAEELRPVPRLDLPRAPGDGLGRVHDREVDLRVLGEPIEERRSIRRRFREHGEHADAPGRQRGVRLEVIEPLPRLPPGGPRDATPVGARGTRVSREERVEAERAGQEPSPGSRRSLPRGPRDRVRRRPARCGARTRRLERLCQRGDGSRRVLQLGGLERLAGPEAEGEAAPAGREVGHVAADLAYRDPPLELTLEVPASARRLPGVDAVEDERLSDVVAVRDREQPRPQVVVLALGELRVVAKLVPGKGLPVEEHAWVEEGRREERSPADCVRARRHEVETPDAVAVVEIEDAAPYDRDGRARPHPRELALEPPRHGDVVCVETRDVPATDLLEAPVQRGREAELSVVSEDDESRVVDRAENVRRPVRRGIVDDDELELGNGLPEHAPHGHAQEALGVVSGEEHGNERRRGFHGRPVAYGR